MPRIPDAAPRRDLNVFYVLDTSGSMEGEPIQILNRTMQETLRALEKVAGSTADAQIKLSVLQFASQVKWMHANGPEDVRNVRWINLSAGGLTQIGAAIRELNKKLTNKEFMKSEVGSLLPIIIFMTDGHPTDEYMAALDEIKQNKLYRRATKIGFAVGEYADVQMIAHLTGDSEAVINTSDLGVFAKLLQFVSVTSSIMGSTSTTANAPGSAGREAVRQALEESGINKDDVTPGFSYYNPEVADYRTADSADVWEDIDDDW